MKRRLTKEDIRDKYCRSRWQQLRDFGYDNLTLDEVFTQYDKVLNNEPTDVIGTIIKGDFEKAGAIP